ncbi:NitT/TauT family transport system ATP-binding protein [Streptomyces zhaozhouensis]|uniref:NitT/TauT family transport system ATP-binding protein n=1 Tax=Streptomyces zhaozhouensis TaxID=1300267 RepID=A0A286DK57_9ACTN|nr:ABC transporter ATP-binding protein [Streptomyces zhaozhouensis]SOD58991.1 NitT/TauT family transport system ATP-binding protein [Streptomyces zhaozhouensis]
MADILIDGVSKVFTTARKRTLALNETSLTIASDEIVCVVGPSGCGKTTLLNLIAGFIEPTAGTISVASRRVEGPGADRAVVFQADAVFPWQSVGQNVGYGMRMRGVGRAERAARVEHYLNLVGLSDFRSAYPKELSGGMRKRVDLARAYASGPEVLLLDEPFGALDLFTKEAMWLALQGVVRTEPKTIVFVTHDIEEALFLGDRVVVMTPRPARVHSVVDVPFGADRSLDLRADTDFQALRNEIAHTLREVQDDAA